MGIMGKGGDSVHDRELKRMFVVEKDPKIKNEYIEANPELQTVIDDYWVVIEHDDNGGTLYEKRFEIDDWAKAIDHYESRSETPVNWEEDEDRDPSKKYQWSMYPKQ